MKTTLTTCALAVAALLAGHAQAGDSPHGDGPRDEMRADKDGDGRVSRAEATAEATQRTNEWFEKLDLDKDGYVTSEEIKKARDTRRGQMQDRFDEHFKAADTNNDGQLSLDEVQASMPRLADRFATLDKDKNGMLSKDELKQGGPGGWHREPKSPG
jgi:Ca2+-binding EF-hand superfamily protein